MALLHGKQLPIKSYTTADGLASNTIYKIVADSRGFIWFCTPEGISRFDGYSFSNYGVSQGLPSSDVRDLIETRGGEYWIATARGVARFHPGGAPNSKFLIYDFGENQPSNMVLVLFEDRLGTIWAGTFNGLYRFNQQAERFLSVDIGMPKEIWEGAIVRAILEDRQGNLWVGASQGLYRRGPDGSVDRYLPWVGRSSQWVISLLEDRQGRLWAGTRGHGLYSLTRNPVSGAFTTRTYTALERMDAIRIRSMIQSRDGTLWMATDKGLAELGSGGNARQFRTHSEPEGLNESSMLAVTEDRWGDLWVGSEAAGAMRIARNGFTTYAREDGFGPSFQASVFGSRAGESLVLARSGSQTKLTVAFFDGEQFHFLWPDFRPIRYFGWRNRQIALQDHTGEWWFATRDGLCRFPNVTAEQLSRTRPKRIYRTADGFSTSDVTAIFEDSRGDIWIVTDSGGKTHLSRWLRSTETFHHYAAADLPAPLIGDRVFAEDRSGNVWFWASDGVLLRYRRGQFERVAAKDLTIGSVDAIYSDRSGRLWIGDEEYGLTRMDDPAADRPSCTRYTTAQGLSSNSIRCITEDRWGRVYVGTGRGLDRIDPATGRIKHYGMSEGLPGADLLNAYWDGQATLWFQTLHAISRFVPELDPQDSPPDVRVSALRIRGVAYTLSDLGVTDLSGLTLPAHQNQIEVDFNGLGFRSADLHYQYMLEGADRTWSPATDRRSVNYASLSPGSYRFLVRAVDVTGIAASAPAVVGFRILSPIWQRWWFLLSAATVAGLIIHSLYRYRLASQLQLEKVRLRIATDLHDDIGAGLSQIALLSELAGQQGGNVSRQGGPLEQIGAASRQLIDSMSEIVWSINPRRDTLHDLSVRMRAFASDVFPAKNIAFRFAAPLSESDLKLALDARRQIFLIFKESVNNVVRHAECSEAEIDFGPEPGKLVLRVRDNGKGFDGRQTFGGHGLSSMRDRARRLGGDLQVASGVGGTAVILTVPVGSGRAWWRRRFLRE